MSKRRYASSRIRGKLKVCRYLESDAATRLYVPETVSFGLANMKWMIDRYGSLYIKPDVGSLGIGIRKLERTAAGYSLKETTNRSQRTRKFNTIDGVYRYLHSHNSEKLIIQQAISLDKLDGRPYDIRVMVQRKPGGQWTCTGDSAKIGGAGKIVTNFYQGGSVLTLRKLHDRLGLRAGAGAARERQLRTAAISIAETLSARKSGMREMGIDFARDRSGRLWVLEVNSNHPQFHPMKSIDRKAYERMKEYAASYGRYSAK
ncbi:YheC/YheD family protein [Paenibacillus sp. strain BS8-2]